MREMLRRLRGVLGLSLTWGALWAAIFTAIFLVVMAVDPVSIDPGETLSLGVAIGAAYGSIAALDKQWKRRVEALPKPNGLARIYSPNELDQLVTDLETAAKQAEARRASKP